MNMHRRLLLIFAALLLTLSSAFSAESVQLLSKAGEEGMLVYWDSLSRTGLLEKNGHQISFRPGDNIVLLDNRRLSVTDAPLDDNGTIFF